MTEPTPELPDDKLIDEAFDLARLICPFPEEIDDGDEIGRIPDDLLRAATIMGELCARLRKRATTAPPSDGVADE